MEAPRVLRAHRCRRTQTGFPPPTPPALLPAQRAATPASTAGQCRAGRASRAPPSPPRLLLRLACSRRCRWRAGCGTIRTGGATAAAGRARRGTDAAPQGPGSAARSASPTRTPLQLAGPGGHAARHATRALRGTTPPLCASHVPPLSRTVLTGSPLQQQASPVPGSATLASTHPLPLTSRRLRACHASSCLWAPCTRVLAPWVGAEDVRGSVGLAIMG